MFLSDQYSDPPLIQATSTPQDSPELWLNVHRQCLFNESCFALILEGLMIAREGENILVGDTLEIFLYRMFFICFDHLPVDC